MVERCSLNHRKIPLLESLFLKSCRLKECNLLNKRLQRYFCTVNFLNFQGHLCATASIIGKQLCWSLIFLEPSHENGSHTNQNFYKLQMFLYIFLHIFWSHCCFLYHSIGFSGSNIPVLLLYLCIYMLDI